MNRSILIVTCDFLVLAAMSLSIGMTQVGDPVKNGTAIATPTEDLVRVISEEMKEHEETVAEKQRLENSLDELNKKLHDLQMSLAEKGQEIKDQDTAAKTLIEENERQLAKIEQLQKEAKLQEQVASAAAKKLTETESKLATTEGKLATAQAETKKVNETLQKTTTQLTAAQNKAATLTGELASAEGKLKDTNILLLKSSGREDELREQLKLARSEAEKARAQLRDTDEKLVTATKALADKTSQYNATVGLLADANSKVKAAQTEIKEKEQQLVTAKADLQKVEAISEQQEKQIIKHEETIKTKDVKIANLEQELRSDAISCYEKAAVELHMFLNNDRLLAGFQIDRSLYLPEITVGGKTYMVAAFRDFSGLNKHEGGFSKVTELVYKRRFPGKGEAAWNTLTANALCLKEDPRVTLIPVDKPLGTPLKTITLDDLRKRGLANLTLFKSSSHGGITAELGDRCSLDMTNGPGTLFIRNSNRMAATPAAEIGDFVISKEGQLVGVVVNVVSSNLGQSSHAVCYVFPLALNLEQAYKIQITKSPGAPLFDTFCADVERLRLLGSAANKEKAP